MFGEAKVENLGTLGGGERRVLEDDGVGDERTPEPGFMDWKRRAGFRSGVADEHVVRAGASVRASLLAPIGPGLCPAKRLWGRLAGLDDPGGARLAA
jgi:hypothetical protein